MRVEPFPAHMRSQAVAAEDAGFDLVVLADAVTDGGRG
jgi:alkanesulfonate monooxygenase SsuD/methylene tetrahydromethanopterin reductase-like flavin-dependent oxidoreductase (luciferase family)